MAKTSILGIFCALLDYNIDMPSKKGLVGSEGEALAARHLKDLGYLILGTNIRERFGEIDILARDQNGTVHFVEVKTISADAAWATGLGPEDYLRGGKLGRMRKMADWYANTYPEKVPGRYQLDLVAIMMGELPAVRVHWNLS